MKSKISLLLAGAALMSSGQLHSELVGSDIRLTNGYRRDKFTSSVIKVNGDRDFLSRDSLSIKDVNIYQIGGKANFYSMGFAVRAEYDYGWVHNGRYAENTVSVDACDLVCRGSVKKGKVRDINIGGTYFFIDAPDFFSGNLYIGPAGGYSRSQQNLTIGNVITNGEFDNVLTGLSYSNRWQGPWAGVDGLFQIANVTVRACYEYHWAHWKAQWTLRGGDAREGFSDKRHSKHAHGNVAFVDAFCNLSEFLVVGVGIKWQRWSQRKGQEKAVDPELAEFFEENDQTFKARHASWDSLAGTIEIGYRF